MVLLSSLSNSGFLLKSCRSDDCQEVVSLNVISFGALGKMYMKEASTGKSWPCFSIIFFVGLDVDLGFASRGVSLRQLLLEHGIKEFFVGSVFRCSEGCLEVPFCVQVVPRSRT